MKLHHWTIAVAAVLFISVPAVTFARHTNSRIDTSHLDGDPVERFPIPVLFGVDYSSLMPDFGDLRGGGTRSHEGQDMRAPQGTPIVSPTEAVVLRTGEGSSSGLYVYTRNPGNETFRYMHLDSIADINPGDKLDPGDLIGTVGDTGNAPDGVFHLHFETRDDDNDPQDPYPRMTDAFTFKEKMSFMKDIMREYEGDEEEYAKLLVTHFGDEFARALEAEYELPDEIEDALAATGVHSRQALLAQLDEIISQIPRIVTRELAVGDQGTEVSLLQTFLIFKSKGPARDELAAAGATGYYGPVTSAAVIEYQKENFILPTGIYDAKTRDDMTSAVYEQVAVSE